MKGWRVGLSNHSISVILESVIGKTLLLATTLVLIFHPSRTCGATPTIPLQN
jgi:hypothetical protein